jgi:protein arginine kinase activator
MICQKCNINPANVQVTLVINGERIDTRLCQECAHELGMDNPFSEQSVEMAQMIMQALQEQQRELEQTPNLACENCGMDLKTFQKEGVLGCEKCYETFEDFLKKLLRRYHGTNRHYKIKRGKKITLSRSERILELQEELEQALKKEEFETAAKLRDEIKALKEK